MSVDRAAIVPPGRRACVRCCPDVVVIVMGTTIDTNATRAIRRILGNSFA
jgi:hypothetical protein